MARPGVSNADRQPTLVILRREQVRELEKARLTMSRRLGRVVDRSALLRGLVDSLMDGRISADAILPEPLTRKDSNG